MKQPLAHHVNREVDIGQQKYSIKGTKLTRIAEEVLGMKKIPEGPLHYRLPSQLIDVIAGGF